MKSAIERYWDFYNMVPDAPLIQREFGYFSLERWYGEGLPREADLGAEFGFDGQGRCDLYGLGWCEAGFEPVFEEQVLESLDGYDLVRDCAGRTLKCFHGRRSGFMPEYVDHPVKDMRTWEERCLWRMDPEAPGRRSYLGGALAAAAQKQAEGMFIGQSVVGGYMYLRSLIGPVELLYAFHDDPELIHACMRAWFELADAQTAKAQRAVRFDELYIGEDICYNHGPLISPDMIREFLFPYYQQLLTNMRARQRGHALHFQVDTDGYSESVIDLYRGIGMDHMSPFEAASGCDVVRVGANYPDLRMLGGFDKRILAKGKDAIDREVDRIFPAMRRRGGYIPTCDHGVPEEVSLENYRHFRKRCLEFA